MLLKNARDPSERGGIQRSSPGARRAPAQRFQLGRPAGGGDLEHGIGAEAGDHAFPATGIPDGLMVLQRIAGLVGCGEELDREKRSNSARGRKSGAASFSVISS